MHAASRVYMHVSASDRPVQVYARDIVRCLFYLIKQGFLIKHCFCSCVNKQG